MLIMENPIEMDDNWRYPYDLGNLHLASGGLFFTEVSAQMSLQTMAEKLNLFQAMAAIFLAEGWGYTQYCIKIDVVLAMYLPYIYNYIYKICLIYIIYI